jgi:hypothetical protein
LLESKSLKIGSHISSGSRIDYKTLIKINTEAARKAVLEYLKTNGDNIDEVAKVFGVNFGKVQILSDSFQIRYPDETFTRE